MATLPNSKVIVNLRTNVSIWIVSRVLWKVMLTCLSRSLVTALTLKRSLDKPDASTLTSLSMLHLAIACYKTRSASEPNSTFHNKCKSTNPITSLRLQLQLWVARTPLITTNKLYARQLILKSLRKNASLSYTFEAQTQNLISLIDSVRIATTPTDLGKVRPSSNIIVLSLEMKKDWSRPRRTRSCEAETV